jgi:hypothetical protein
MKKSIYSFTVALLFLYALTAVVSSCDNDESNMTREEMLTAKSWKILSSKTNNVADVIEDCEKDDFLTFATNGTYTYNIGTKKCDSYESNESGTWEFSSDEKYLIIDGDSISIVEMTASRLTFLLVDGSYRYEVTYISF